MDDTQAELERAVREHVDRTAHVRGAALGTIDGHPIVAHLPDVTSDAATVAAMGAALRGLATQLVRVADGDATSADTDVRSAGVRAHVVDVDGVATLTIFAAEHADPDALAMSTRRLCDRLAAILTAAATAEP